MNMVSHNVLGLIIRKFKPRICEKCGIPVNTHLEAYNRVKGTLRAPCAADAGRLKA